MNQYSNILVTGASGMVGKSLVKKLTESKFSNLLVPTSIELNLLNQKSVTSFFEQNKIDCVFHLAGKIGGIGASISNPVDFLYENMMMAFNTIYVAHKNNVKKLLYLGSSCIYPLNCEQPMKEEFLLTGKPEPTNEGYTLAKISGMKLCEYLNRQYDREYVCIVPPNLYGFNDNFCGTNSHVISSLIWKFNNAKINNHPHVEIWGSGVSKREFLFVDDISEAMIYFMNSSELINTRHFINTGSSEEISIYDLAYLIKSIVCYEGNIVFNKNKPDGMPNKLLDNTIANSLGWKPKIDLKTGLKLSYEWYKNSINN